MKSLILAALILAASGCKPVTVPNPPPPVNHNNAVVTVDETGQVLPGAVCTLETESGLTNQDGYYLFLNLAEGEHTITCTHHGYEIGTTTYINDRDQNVPVTMWALNMLPRLAADGQHFITIDGPFTAIETSDFALYQRYLANEDIRIILKQRSEIGFNMVRVFGMYNGALGHFLPNDYGDTYFSALPSFCRLLSRYGLYVEFVAFADATVTMPSEQGQLIHWNLLTAALQAVPNVLLEAVNENDQPINRLVSLASLPRPIGIFASHGSNGSQAWPVQPYWDYATFHTNDAPEWVRKVGHNAMEIWDGPTLANENTRAPDRFANTRVAYDAAAGAALLAAGSSYHTIHGKESSLWDGTETEIAMAWVAGAKSVPLTCQSGPYKHRADLDGPGSGILRAYQRGDDPSCVVLIHPPN